MTQDFDLPSLLETLASWPAIPLPTRSASDPVLDRIRQVMVVLKGNPGAICTADLMPLLRQVSLAHASSPGGGARVRVPTAQGWPSADQWRSAEFEVQDYGDWLVVHARPPRLAFLGSQADLFDEVFGRVPARSEHHILGDPVFKKLLGLPTYTGPGQREAVRALVQLPEGETLIANLPTGSGKSVLAQLPPLLAPPGCMTVVIVPTVALAMDQAERMRSILTARDPNAPLPPMAYHAGLDEEQRREVWRAIRSGGQRVLFLSPEHATGSLRPLLDDAAREGRISHVVVDEAHLAIGWGNGFRPAFQLLPALIRGLQRATARKIRLVLASATLTGSTIEGLKQLFSMGQRIHVVAGVYLRPEPRYAFSHASDSVAKQQVLEAVRLAPRPVILYATRPEEAERWASQLRDAGYGRLGTFTGRTGSSEREALLERWKGNELDIMVATSAFGLGVDKSDVRTVIHATLPESLDRYYQEVGRSGRDGFASASVLVYTDTDAAQAKRMAVSKVARVETAFERWTLMIQQAKSDPDRADVHWLDLNRLPARLVRRSDASAAWNIRTLTLMARAGMIELVALARGPNHQDAREVVSEDDAQFAAVRLLKDNLRQEKAFHAALTKARKRIRKAGLAGYQAMLSVATGRTEIAEALRETYSVTGRGVWSPVSRYCGGCPQHWSANRWPGKPLPPVVPRLNHFETRDRHRAWTTQWPMASENLLVIAIPADAGYPGQALAVARLLIDVLQPHTLGLGPGLAPGFERALLGDSTQPPVTWPFIEGPTASSTGEGAPGEREVRLTVWSLNNATPLPNALWTSQADLEVLVIPDSVTHPTHPGRRFIDTVPHIYAEEAVKDLLA